MVKMASVGVYGFRKEFHRYLSHICLQEPFYYFILTFLKLKNGLNSNINKIVCYMYMYEGGGTYGTLA